MSTATRTELREAPVGDASPFGLARLVGGMFAVGVHKAYGRTGDKVSVPEPRLTIPA